VRVFLERRLRMSKPQKVKCDICGIPLSIPDEALKEYTLEELKSFRWLCCNCEEELGEREILEFLYSEDTDEGILRVNAYQVKNLDEVMRELEDVAMKVGASLKYLIIEADSVVAVFKGSYECIEKCMRILKLRGYSF